MVKKLPVVVTSEEMDDDTFFMHFNARHVPLAGLSEVRSNVTEGVVKSMRQYHQHVHFRGVEDDPPNQRPVNHVHEEEE